MHKKKKSVGITINTDTSFNHQVNVGGYAFWIVSDSFKIQRSGAFKDSVKSPLIAEVMCIGNAIAHLLQRGHLPEVDFLIINTDCTNAINMIKCKQGEYGIKVHELWQQLIRRTKSKKNQFRHVKAHTNANNARSKVNEWCDLKAKEQMRALVKIKQHEN